MDTYLEPIYNFFNAAYQAAATVLQHPLFKLGAKTVSLAEILKLLILFAIVLLLARFFRLFLLGKVLNRTRLASSLQYAIGKVGGYLFIAIGIYIALQSVGIDLSALAVMAGAIGVGIGFGLQNITNNFISGLIILAERPITIGDRVEVEGVAGQVKEINLRSTTILTNDNISVIVPNSQFISNTVVNWSHGDPKVRMRLPFGIAYGSNVEKMKEVVSAMAATHSKVLDNPAPTLFFTGFGDSSLNFELVVWTAEMTFTPRRFHSELYFGLEKTLRENQIEIPFPQRDLHVRSGTFSVQAAKDGSLTGKLSE